MEFATRFAIIEEDTATDPKVLEVYDSIRRELGFGMVPNLFKSMATNPDFLEANWLTFRAIVLFCRLAVQAHCGKIWVESVASKGSRFFFTLPLPAETAVG